MRVLVTVTPHPDSAAQSMANALAMRHEVDVFDYGRWHKPFGRFRRANAAFALTMDAAGRSRTALADRALRGYARGRKYDLVLILRAHQVPPATVDFLAKETGALVVGWFMDAIVNLGDAAFVLARYHRIFFKDRVIVDRFRQGTGTGRYDFLPQAFDPTCHRPVPVDAAAMPDVATFGNSYAYRAALLQPLLDCSDIRTVLYGRPSGTAARELASHYRPSIYGLEKSRAMRATRISLNTNHFGELRGVNKRTFELAGIGAFQLTDGPTVSEYLEPEKEVATFSGPHELIERVRYYLTRPERRSAIAHAGLVRAWRDHSYHHRLNAMFDAIPELRSATKLPTPKRAPSPDEPLEWSSGQSSSLPSSGERTDGRLR